VLLREQMFSRLIDWLLKLADANYVYLVIYERGRKRSGAGDHNQSDDVESPLALEDQGIAVGYSYFVD